MQEAQTAPNPQDFLKDERPRLYNVRFSVEGEINAEVFADSLDEARVEARKLLENEEFLLDIDGVVDAEIDHLAKAPGMYLVTRDGKEMRVSHLKAGDEPRERNEYEASAVSA